MSNLIPGEIIPEQGEIELNLGKQVKTVTVSNSGDRPVQVGSHFHFFETNIKTPELISISVNVKNQEKISPKFKGEIRRSL